VLLWLAPVLFLSLFYFYPLGSILQVAFSRSQAGLAGPFYEAFSSPAIRGVIAFTFWQAALSTLLTLLIGLPGAYLFARYEFRGKSLVRALTAVPFVLPTLVVAAAFNTLLGSRGWINLALMDSFNLLLPPIQFTNSLTAILMAHVFYNTTIVLRMVGDYWSHLDPRMSQAAQVLGASPLKTLQHVTLPLLMPAILAAALLVFIFDFTSFGVILVLGGPRFATMEVEIYYQTISLFNLPLAAALSIIQLTCTLGMTILYTQLSKHLQRPQTLRPEQYTQRRLQTWQSRVFVTLFMGLLLGLLTIPLLSLAARSVISLERGQNASNTNLQFTLAYYQELNQNRRDSLFFIKPINAIGISLAYATMTVLLALALGLPAALTLARDQDWRLNRWLDPLIMLPLGTSAVTLGLGFIVALDQPPFDLRASPLLIPIAHTLVAFPFVVRSLVPSLRSIRPRLRQAAAVLGAAPSQVVQQIDLPLVGRAVLVAAAFAFSISLGEFGATALVSRPEYPTVPVMIYRYISQPGSLNYGQALALSTLLMIATALGMLVIERLRLADIGEF
jgi:thiamine transport system permease protein